MKGGPAMGRPKSASSWSRMGSTACSVAPSTSTARGMPEGGVGDVGDGKRESLQEGGLVCALVRVRVCGLCIVCVCV